MARSLRRYRLAAPEHKPRRHRPETDANSAVPSVVMVSDIGPAPARVECLSCGQFRPPPASRPECPRCGYLGWALSTALNEHDRRWYSRVRVFGEDGDLSGVEEAARPSQAGAGGEAEGEDRPRKSVAEVFGTHGNR
jgi:hypothetical protein